MKPKTQIHLHLRPIFESSKSPKNLRSEKEREKIHLETIEKLIETVPSDLIGQQSGERGIRVAEEQEWGQGAKRNLLGIPGPNFTSSWTRFKAANKRWSTVGAGSDFFSFHLGVDSVRRFWRANECLLERLQVRGGRVPRRLGRARRIKNRL